MPVPTMKKSQQTGPQVAHTDKDDDRIESNVLSRCKGVRNIKVSWKVTKMEKKKYLNSSSWTELHVCIIAR